MSEQRPHLTVNQLVAYNLARARRADGSTQEEVAARLTAITGKRWTAATLGAAERSWESGRTREFDANELAAFCIAFDQPLAFFFLPRREDDKLAAYALGTPANPDADFIGALELLIKVLADRPRQEYVDELQRALDRQNMIWTPGMLTKKSAPQRAIFWELKRDIDQRISEFQREFEERQNRSDQ